MTAYLIKLIILIPIMGGLIFTSLWLYKKYQTSVIATRSKKSINLVEIQPLGNFAKLAAVEFEGRRLLLSISRNRVECLSKADFEE